jgi:hypothetical protein
MSVFKVKQAEVLKLIDHINLMSSILESFISLRLSTIRNSIDDNSTKSTKVNALTSYVEGISEYINDCITIITDPVRVDRKFRVLSSHLPLAIMAYTAPIRFTSTVCIPTKIQRLPTSKKLLIKALGLKLQTLHQSELCVSTKSNLMKAGFKDHYSRKLTTPFGSTSVITTEGFVFSVPNLHHIILLNIFLIYALSELDTNRSRGISSLWISKKIRRLLQGSYDLPPLNVMSEKLSSCIDLNSINFYCENRDVMTHLLYRSLSNSTLVSDSNMYTLEQILNRLLLAKSKQIPLLKAM